MKIVYQNSGRTEKPYCTTILMVNKDVYIIKFCQKTFSNDRVAGLQILTTTFQRRVHRVHKK